MRRRAFLCGSVAMLAAPLAAEAQQAGKVVPDRLSCCRTADRRAPERKPSGMGSVSSATSKARTSSSSTAGPRGRPERLPALAAELVQLKVDVIVAAELARGPGGQEGDDDDPNRHGGRGDPVGAGSSPAWRGPAVTSRGCRADARDLSARGWSFSGRPSRRRAGRRPLEPGAIRCTRRRSGERRRQRRARWAPASARRGREEPSRSRRRLRGRWPRARLDALIVLADATVLRRPRRIVRPRGSDTGSRRCTGRGSSSRPAA